MGSPLPILRTSTTHIVLHASGVTWVASARGEAHIAPPNQSLPPVRVTMFAIWML